MQEQPGTFWHPLTSGPASHVLQTAGLAMPPLFMLLYPSPLAGVDILITFGGVAATSGALLRTWWASVIVPGLVVATVAGHMLLIRDSSSVRESELSLVAALVLGLGLLGWVALAALAGTWVSRQFIANDRDG